MALIEKAYKTNVKIVDDVNKSELILLYPFFTKKQKNRLKVIGNLYRLAKKKPSFSSLMGYPHERIIAVSHENLDSPDWSWFKNLLLTHNIKRLTFWPEEIDPDGCRFPYWWNYVQHEDFELEPEFYSRYGKPLCLQKLMSPFQPNRATLDRIAFLNRHLRYPRNNQVKILETFKPVDIFMAPKTPWNGTKHALLTDYKYIFCAENSCGYGYETEKLPEAWDAGCIPLGYIQNPLSQFSDEVFTESKIDIEKINAYPLIKQKPDLQSLIRYIRN
ncbi:hypothetical protein [Thiomicrospira microaerophila]|uniref:hypothetical protein n=1 Tax=Thiomicrospira microaerophila TaxID=406020 RepID=UPI0012FD7569|nr:hypothetical protein [Thiomicrospira microaerophila]